MQSFALCFTHMLTGRWIPSSRFELSGVGLDRTRNIEHYEGADVPTNRVVRFAPSSPVSTSAAPRAEIYQRRPNEATQTEIEGSHSMKGIERSERFRHFFIALSISALP